MLIAKRGKKELHLLPKMSCRHGLIAGSTGGGKSVTLQVIAENFSREGVPVFMSDIKGDLGGIRYRGGDNKKVTERLGLLGVRDFKYSGNPVCMWDVFGSSGDLMKATLMGLGPMLITRLLNLTSAQEGSLYQIFKIATDNDIDINDLADLYSIINFITENVELYEGIYGKISKQSMGAIQRSTLMLQENGNDVLFSKEGAFNVAKLLTTLDNKGVINILDATRLIKTPKVYATFLLWLLSELYNILPEEGDLDKPKLVFFFDEAHLLFDGAPKVLIEKIEQLIKLIRSKGVGVFFVTQNPADIPDAILSQLGNRVQHSMRAFTPKEQKAIRTIAQTFRSNSALNVESSITNLKVGEALISFLDENGSPTIVEKALIYPPRSHIGAYNNNNMVIKEAEIVNVCSNEVVFTIGSSNGCIDEKIVTRGDENVVRVLSEFAKVLREFDTLLEKKL